MAVNPNRVLKKTQVRPDGQRPVAMPGPGDPVAGQPQVSVVTRDDRSAVIEVRCACGHCTYVQCEWPVPGAPPPAPPQA